MSTTKTAVATPDPDEPERLEVPVVKRKPVEAGVSLVHLSAADALTQLRGVRASGVVALVEYVPGRPLEQVVADGHAFDGQTVNGAWRFAPASLAMAARVAGWRKVEHLEPGRVRLS